MLKEKRKEQLIHYAGEVFSEKGYYSANVADIIGRAGIARGTFYLYFDGKRQIFDSVIDILLQEIDRRLKPIDLASGSPSPFDQLRDNASRVLTYLWENRQQTLILLRHAEGLDEECDRKLEQFYRKLEDMIQSSLNHGVEMGLVRQCNTRLAASCIIGLGKEAIRQLISSHEVAPDLGELVEELLNFGLLGVLLNVPPHYRWITGEKR
ncbi:MAG: TetR/AcrR family transcriptional regulator [Dehalococcoidia bacterium]